MYPDRSIFGKVTRFIAVAILFLALGSCGGGSGGSGSGLSVGGSPQQINGVWFGSLQDVTLGTLHTYTVTIVGGVVTKIQIDGVPQMDGGQVLTGTISKDSDVLYSITLSDGTEAGFIVDAGTLHATFVDDAFNFGVVLKDATGLPAFLVNDTDGDWSGDTVVTDFVVSAEFTSTANCVNLMCIVLGNSITSNVDISGFFSAAFGLWTGTYSNTAGEVGVAAVILSPDKQFAGSYLCDNAGVFPGDCDFSAWVRL